jgi:hypothetical protein
MSIIVTSTADTPEQVAAVIERAGMKPEAVETEKPAEAPKPEEKEAPAPTEGEKPQEGKIEGEPEPPKDQEKPKEGKEEEDDAEEPERDEKGRFKGRGVQKKIDKLVKLRSEEHDKRVAAEARLSDLEKQLAELKNTAAKPEDTKTPEKKEPEKPAAPEEPEPKLKDFVESLEKYGDYEGALEAWQTAREAWRDKKRTADLEAKIADLEAKLAKKGDEKDQQREAAQQWADRVESAKEKHADWDEVMEQATSRETMINPAPQAAIVDSPIATDILYHLAKHPEEAKRIAGLSDVAAIREIGKLEAKLSAEPEKKPAAEAPKPAEKPAEKTPEQPKPRPSAAPEPIKPVGGTNAKTAEIDPYKDAERMTPQQWSEWRAKNRRR